jgi:antitoxin ParD1/3/4
MPKMSLELTDSLQSFVDSESSQQGFVSTDEDVQYVLQKEQDRARVRALIEEGEASPAEVISVEDYIASLRNQIAAEKDL